MDGLFSAPELDVNDVAVISEINQIRTDLQAVLRAPRRWNGGLRRTAQARAIQGSNTIEGYTVSDQDAIAAVDDEAPMSADQQTWAEILGYRRVLTYIVNVASQQGFRLDLTTLNAMHFMLLEHDLGKSPGRYRSTDIYVQDERDPQPVYRGPDQSLVPALMRSLADTLSNVGGHETMIRAAMAHLNLVMIHPYRDGNGRMARALQTLVLAQDAVLEPTFASIEEWLGAHTEDYYRILALTGGGSWHPENDTHLWVKFNLRAHHLQAQTLQRRFEDASRLYLKLDELIVSHNLPDRVADPLFDAVLGGRVTRPSYAKRIEGLEIRTATRDLQRLSDLGLLTPRGQTRGRYYLAGGELAELRAAQRGARKPLDDPYPDLMIEVAARQLRTTSFP